MKKVTKEDLAQFDSDFVKMFISGLGVGLVIFGYSYSHTFFRSFGLSLYQLKMEWVDILFRGVALMQDFRVALVFSTLIILGSLAFSARNLVGATGKILITAFAVFGILLTATFGGQALGYAHAKAIWKDGVGKRAFCRFDPDAKGLQGLVAKIDQLTRERRIRMIYQSKEQTFLAPVFETTKDTQRTGEAYVIPTSSISYCRVVGS